jgi:hypothetical protein
MAPRVKGPQRRSHVGGSREFLAKHKSVLHRKTRTFGHSRRMGVSSIANHHHSP